MITSRSGKLSYSKSVCDAKQKKTMEDMNSAAISSRSQHQSGGDYLGDAKQNYVKLVKYLYNT